MKNDKIKRRHMKEMEGEMNFSEKERKPNEQKEDRTHNATDTYRYLLSR